MLRCFSLPPPPPPRPGPNGDLALYLYVDALLYVQCNVNDTDPLPGSTPQA